MCDNAAPTGRIRRERKTIQRMIGIYCRAHHGPADGLCDDCRGLYEYALARLERCLFGADKPACAACPVHCYKPSMRERVRTVMRYAGPRMLLRHPFLALLHQYNAWWSRRQAQPELRNHAETKDRPH